MKPHLKLITFLSLASTSLAFSQAIVYQDTFDEDGLDTNTGTGGGGDVAQFNTAGSFVWGDGDDDDEGLSTGANGAGSGGQITTFFTDNSFNVANGFTLEVVFDMISNVDDPSAGSPFPSNHLSFGLVSDPQEDINNLFSSNGFAPTIDGIGFSLGIRDEFVDEGLLDWDADGDGGTAGLQTTLNAIAFITGAVDGLNQTLVLNVAANGNYTYTYGTDTGSGTTNIDLTQTYFFKARTQGSLGNVIQSITLSTNSAQFNAPTIESTASVHDSDVSIDLNITFDPSATSATLVNSADASTNIDLLAIDASDAVPNDGIVVVSESPANLGLNTYEVSASRLGIAPLSESLDLTLIDPNDEAADNALSTAIKANSPLFYYRYEDASDSTFVRDSSGNRFHTNDFTANLLGVAFGNGPDPGGVGNAADFRPIAGARGIRVPATSEMSESFTFTSVINVDEFTVVNPRSLFSMSNGTGTGAILLSWQGFFQSSLDGTVDNLSVADEFPLNTTCIIHYVFTADEINGGGEHVLYVNGVEAAAAVTVADFGPNEGNWIIGANTLLGDPSWFDWVDETAIFEEALTSAQITTHVDAFFAAADPLLGFYSDTTEIDEGESVQLSWKVSDSATAVTINGAPVAGDTSGGVFTQTFDPTITTLYTIQVTGPNGVSTSDINVVVNLPDADIVITSCTFDDATPPNVVIEFTGAPDTTYTIFASPDLDDFTIFITSVTTDEFGVGISQSFEGLGDSEFYRVVLP